MTTSKRPTASRHSGLDRCQPRGHLKVAHRETHTDPCSTARQPLSNPENKPADSKKKRRNRMFQLPEKNIGPRYCPPLLLQHLNARTATWCETFEEQRKEEERRIKPCDNDRIITLISIIPLTILN